MCCSQRQSEAWHEQIHEAETEQQPASKVTNEDLSSQYDPLMASTSDATSTPNVTMSDAENNNPNSQPPNDMDKKDDPTTPDSIGENECLDQ